jgi:hypothetical protein
MDDDDTIAADPDDDVELGMGDLTDGSTPGENQEVGIGVED